MKVITNRKMKKHYDLEVIEEETEAANEANKEKNLK